MSGEMLSGEIEWHGQKDAAERMTRPLMGVVGVSNLTTIKSCVNTADLDHVIDVALHRSWSDPKTITLSAEGGKIKLTGNIHAPGDNWTAGSSDWAA
jgi:osmotically-inducible protein OsmY